ncbi:hypothetical protein [Rhizobium laguerreae]|uniref:hypothetical protein n=1 Tax=Rhizobium laguerreae TaxID=1076926 RepID=UPI001C90AC51|nr:hypothetical protein [Rhizobium laguerreae]MBY3556236.1 hypothetical protein [Rhizobium laguerreae]
MAARGGPRTHDHIALAERKTVTCSDFAQTPRMNIRHAAAHHFKCPIFHPFPAAQNLFPELRMVLALPFALYSNEQKGEPRFWHLMK